MRPGHTTAPPYSAAAHLDALRAQAARATARAFALLPETQQQLAGRLDCARSRISALADPRSDQRIRLHEAAALPPVAAVVLAEFVAGPAYAVVELPAEDDLGDDMAAAIEAHRESNEAVHEALVACADGRITAAEGERLEREGLEAVRALMRLVELGRLAQRERVIAARRIRGAR
jgi:hypothetical protein